MKHLAYVDLTSGSIFIQTVFGVVFAAAVVLRGFIRKLFTRLKLAVTRQKS